MIDADRKRATPLITSHIYVSENLSVGKGAIYRGK